MHVLNVKDVNDALPRGLAYLRDAGLPDSSRNGGVLVAPGPVSTVYKWPDRRVLFDPQRDANPFFHLFEALWILRGRADVSFLTMFNKRMADYSDNGHTFHAPYGYRLRHQQGFDQIQRACDMLATDPKTRRVVLQIWDAALDLGKNSKDLPCNDMIFCGMRPSPVGNKYMLDIAVANRSNDTIWGAYGANAVQFSILQEYMAAKIGALVGEYTQISFNYHVYTDNPQWANWIEKNAYGVNVPSSPYDHGGIEPSPLCRNPQEALELDRDLVLMFSLCEPNGSFELTGFAERMWEAEADEMFRRRAFKNIILPMLHLLVTRTENHPELDPGKCDWHAAGAAWVKRRQQAKEQSK